MDLRAAPPVVRGRPIEQVHEMPNYDVRIAIRGMASSWRFTKVQAANAARAIEIAEQREIAEGYDPFAFKAENAVDAHDYAEKGAWPF